MVEAVDHHEQRDDHAQQIQRQADAIQADVVGALDNGNPLGLGNELHRARLAKIKTEQRECTDGNSGDGSNERDHLDGRFVGFWRDK